MLKAFIRYMLLGLVGVALLLVSIMGVYYYFVVGKQRNIQELVSEVVWRETGALAYFEDYRFGLGGDFPFISLKLKNIVLHDSAYAEHGRELLHVKGMKVSFRPWELIKGDIIVKSLEIDSAKVKLYRSPEGRMNLIVSKKASPTHHKEERAPSHSVFTIDKIKVNGLDFEFLDSMRLKDYHVDLGQTVFSFDSNEKSDFVRIEGDWFFDGLTFKMEAGSFVTNKAAEVDLLVEIDSEANLIHFRPSRLKIDGNNYDVEGSLKPGKPAAYLKLQISNPGIRYADALSMVNQKIRHGLSNFSVDAPVAFKLLLEGPMTPGRPLPLTLDFSFSNSGFAFKNTRITEASAVGHFDNNCDPSGIVDPHSGCLMLSSFSGKLADIVPIEAVVEVRDLEDPYIVADANVKTSFADLGDILPPGRFRPRSGAVDVSLHYGGKISRLDSLSEKGFHDVLNGKVRISDAALTLPSPEMQLKAIDAELVFDAEELRIEYLNLLVNQDSFRLKGQVEEPLAFILNPNGQRLKADLEVRAPRLVVDHFLSPPGTKKKSKNPKNQKAKKETHFGKVIEALYAKLEAGLLIQSDEVIFRKLQAKDVLIVSHLKNECEGVAGGCMVVDTFQATIYDGIPLNASMMVYNPQDPQIRLDAQVNANLPLVEGLTPKGKFKFQKGEASIDLHYKGRLEDYLDMKKVARNADLNGKVVIRDAAVDYLPQGYRIEDFRGALTFDECDLMVDSLDFTVNNTQLFINGEFHDFLPYLFDPDSILVADLKIATPNLDFANFPRRKKAEKKKEKPREPKSENAIARGLGGVLSRLEGSLEIDAGELHFRGFDAKDVRFHASFLDGCPGSEEGSGCVIVDTFSATLFNNAPLQASLKIEDLSDPFFTVEASTKIPLENLNNMFPKHQFIFHDGTVAVDFKYAGRPHSHFDVPDLGLNAAVEGQARLENASFDVVAKGYEFRNLNADLGISNNDLDIRNIDLELNKNALHVDGEIQKLIPFLFLPDQSLKVALNIKSDELNFSHFSAPKNFEQVQKDTTTKPTAITGAVDDALSKIEADLKLSSKVVKYESFYAENIQGEFRMNPKMMALTNVQMDIARGKFYINGEIGGLDVNAPKIDIVTSFEHVDVSEIFSAFDNFGQDDMTSENIRGDLTAVITFSGEANSNYDLIQETLEGRLDLEIVDGQLVDLPALNRINNFLFRNRNMQDVQFATLQNTFILEGGHLELSQFKIFSTVLAILVEGRYCLDDNAHTDLLVSVPLANLWKSGISVDRLEEFRTGKRRGVRILIRARNKDGTMKVGPVLSKKAFQNGLELEE